MIRPATMDDIPALVAMGRVFFERLDLPFDYIPRDTAENLAWLISEGGVFIGKNGAIGGLLQSAPFNKSVKFANEHFWWSEGGEGIRLLKRYEDWASESGASWVVMTTIETLESKASEVLRRRSYRRQESQYVKVL